MHKRLATFAGLTDRLWHIKAWHCGTVRNPSPFKHVPTAAPSCMSSAVQLREGRGAPPDISIHTRNHIRTNLSSNGVCQALRAVLAEGRPVAG